VSPLIRSAVARAAPAPLTTARVVATHGAMGSVRTWHRLVRLLLACAALGAAVAPERARAEYAEVDGAAALMQPLAPPRALVARVQRLRLAAVRHRARAAHRSRPRLAARTIPVRSRLYVHKRSLLL
jgi:hypothetical protein